MIRQPMRMHSSEVVTNAYEAFRDKPPLDGITPVYQLRSWIDEVNNKFVLSMRDEGVGMNLQTTIGVLLQPSVSGWLNSDLLHFGQGFYTLFRGAEEVRIRTTKDEVTTLIRLIPVKDKGTLLDLTMEVTQESAGGAKSGTAIEWVTSAEDPTLPFLADLGTTWSLCRFFDPAKMKLVWNDTQINQDIEVLASRRHANGDEVTIFRSAGERVLTSTNSS